MSILTRILGLGSKADAKAGCFSFNSTYRTVREVRTHVDHPRNSEFSYPVLKMECYGVGLIKIGVEWTLDRRVDQSVCMVKTSSGGADR